MQRILFSDEVGQLLRVSQATVRELVSEGRLRATRLRPRGRLMFDQADVEAALRGERQPAEAAAPQ